MEMFDYLSLAGCNITNCHCKKLRMAVLEYLNVSEQMRFVLLKKLRTD